MKIVAQILVLMTFGNVLAQLPQELIKPTQRTSTFDQYAGSIYSNEDFDQADVIDERSGTYTAKLRYNAYTDAIEYSDKASKLHELEKNTSTHVKIGNEYYYYCKFKNGRGFNQFGYYILVELNDNFRIYKRAVLDITEPKEKDVVTGHVTMGKVKMEEVYYMEQNNKLTELPQSKKDILTVFSDQEEALKQYMKDEKIKLKKAEDLVKFIAKYNSLKGGNIIDPSRSMLSNRDGNN